MKIVKDIKQVWQNILSADIEDKIAYVGTALLFLAPYLLSFLIGFILAFVGVILLIPQVYVKKQWNLVALNITSAIGYMLQILNVI